MPRSYVPHADVNFGPVPRSEEHIWPESIFGRIVTHDLCALCNSEFGKLCDHALVKDGRMLDAAKKAGFSVEELMHCFDVVQRTSTGRNVKGSVKRGIIRHRIEKFDDGVVGIPMTDGKIIQEHLENIVQKMKRRALSKQKLQLSNPVSVELMVRNFLGRVQAKPNTLHVDLTLEETFRVTTVDQKGEIKLIYHPWETDWSLAKSIFEFSSLLWPAEYLAYCKCVLDYFKTFIAERAHDADAGTGLGILKFAELNATPSAQHEGFCVLQPHFLQWRFIFFGTASWTFESTLEPGPGKNAPSTGYTIEIKNPFGAAGVPDANVTLTKVGPAV